MSLYSKSNLAGSFLFNQSAESLFLRARAAAIYLREPPAAGLYYSR